MSDYEDWRGGSVQSECREGLWFQWIPGMGISFHCPLLYNYTVTIQVVAVWLFSFYPLPHVIVCVLFFLYNTKTGYGLHSVAFPLGGKASLTC